jgi:hypothetical protein
MDLSLIILSTLTGETNHRFNSELKTARTSPDRHSLATCPAVTPSRFPASAVVIHLMLMRLTIDALRIYWTAPAFQERSSFQLFPPAPFIPCSVPAGLIDSGPWHSEFHG